MATKQYQVCDYCKTSSLDKYVRIQKIFLQTGWEVDEHGNDSKPAGKEYDLCAVCLAQLCQHMLHVKQDFKINKRVIDAFEKHRKKYNERMGSVARS
jgi:hypothetical protein